MVLVVEDDPDTSEMMGRLISRFGYDVKSAANAAGALEVMRASPIRVAVLDYNLPDHDGLWLLRQMNDDSDLAGVRAVFLSGAFEHDVAREAFALGAADWFVKGVHSFSRIMETVGRLHGPPPPAPHAAGD